MMMGLMVRNLVLDTYISAVIPKLYTDICYSHLFLSQNALNDLRISSKSRGVR